MKNNNEPDFADFMEGKIVELRPCYEYTCENCGRDSHIPITIRETRDGAFFIAKAQFTCSHCETPLKGIPWMPVG